MDKIVNKLMENRKINEARVGAFYFIGNKIISNDADVRDADSYGDFVNYSSHWDLWNAFVKAYPEYDELDYDYFPRGRVVFDRGQHKYILYIDPKLNSSKYIDKIKSRYGLSSGAFRLGNDEHYSSQQPVSDIDDEELESDVIFHESLDHYVTRETY